MNGVTDFAVESIHLADRMIAELDELITNCKQMEERDDKQGAVGGGAK